MLISRVEILSNNLGAMFFMQAYIIPEDKSIIKLSCRDVRIHITVSRLHYYKINYFQRYALVIVQDIPPKQRLYLNLEDLFDVYCVQNRFVFRALAYSWSKPYEFLFVGDQIPQLRKKLHCLLSVCLKLFL